MSDMEIITFERDEIAKIGKEMLKRLNGIKCKRIYFLLGLKSVTSFLCEEWEIKNTELEEIIHEFKYGDIEVV